jgi:hypothetical protein
MTDTDTLRCLTNPALQVLADNWDSHDPWGSGMVALGAVCDVLTAANEQDRIDPGAGYRPAMGQTQSLDDLADSGEDEAWDCVALANELREGTVTVDDLARAARILHLYLDRVRAADLDY